MQTNRRVLVAIVSGVCCIGCWAGALHLPEMPVVWEDSGDVSASAGESMTLQDELKDVPGVVLTQMSGQGSAASLAVRGFGDDALGNVVLVVDGLSQWDPNHLLPDMSQWLAINLAQVSVQAQTNSVLYGNRAVGGVVRVTTKPLQQRPEQFSVAVGSYNTHVETLQVKTTHDRWTATTLVQTAASDNYREHNQSDSAHMQSGVAYDNGDAHWQWTVSAADDQLQLPGALTAQEVAADPTQASNDSDTLNTHALRSVLQGDFLLANNWQYQSQLQLVDLTTDGIQSSSYTSSGTGVHWHQMLHSLDETYLRSVWDIGTDIRINQYDYDSDDYQPDSDQTLLALFEQSTTSLGARWSLLVGQRVAVNDTHETEADVTWQSEDTAYATHVALRYDWDKSRQMELRRATGFRFPTADEVAWTEDNTRLQTQTNTSYEWTFKQTQQPLNYKIGVYYLHINNEIMYVPYQDSLYFGYNENLPPTSRVGAQLTIKDRLSPRWQVQGGLDWVNAVMCEGADSGLEIPFVAPWQWELGVHYRPQPYWTLSLRYHQIGSRYPMGDVDNLTPQEPAYGVLDGTLSYHHGFVESSLMLNNITDQHYNEAAVLSTNSEGQATVGYYPAPGINVLCRVAVIF